MRRCAHLALRITCLLVALACGASAAPGQQVPRAEVDSRAAEVRFRRVFAPADRVQDWPRGNTRYVPVDPQEFERLAQGAEQASSSAAAALATRITSARYEARCDGGDTLIGSVSWRIRHTAGGGANMPLAPCGLALANPRWTGSVDQGATLGIDEDGRISLLVSSDGELHADWTLRGRAEPSGAQTFRIELPVCPASTIELSLPATLGLASTQGIVLPVGGDPVAGRKLWRIVLGGQSSTVLRLLPASAAGAADAGALVRETLVYDLSTRGLDLTVLWRLSADGPPLRRVQAVLDPGLQLVAARLADADVPWSAIVDGSTGASVVGLELPEPIQGAERLLRLAAIATVRTEQPWHLPRIRASDLRWQEGSATLVIREPLELGGVVPHACRQIKTAELPAPNRGASLEWELYSADAALEVDLLREHRPTQSASGSRLEFLADEVKAEMVASFARTAGQRLTIAGTVARGWAIDSVESIPRDALADWRLASAADGQSLLTAHLARPLASENPLTLLVRARRPRPSQEDAGISSSDLRVVGFADVTTSERLVALRGGAGFEVDVVGLRHATRLDRSRLSPSQTALFTELPREAVYKIDDELGQFTATVSESQPRYRAEVHLTATVAGQVLEESYRLHVVPSGNQVERLVVVFGEPRSEAVHWQTADGRGAVLAARRLSLDELAAARVPAGHEGWEVHCPPARGGSIDLVARRATAFDQGQSLSLAWLPLASGQSGQVVVRAAVDLPLAVENVGLKSTAVPDSRTEPDPPPRACYEYTPGDGTQGLRIVTRATALATPAAVVLSSRTDSSLAGGRLLQTATFRVENRGAASFELRAPAGVQIETVTVDSARVRVGESPVRIPLPSGREFVTVVAEFTAAAPPLGLFTSLAVPRLATDLPVLAGEHCLWLPPTVDLFSLGGGAVEAARNPLSWSERLLGPLGRPAGQRRFEPLRLADWARLTRTADQAEAALELQFWAELAGRLPVPNAETQRRNETWGEWLGRAADVAQALDRRLLVDAPALAEADVSPATLVLEASPLPPPADAAVELTARGLVLRAAGPEWIVTSASRADAIRLDGASAAGDRSLRYLSATVWSTSSATASTAWTATAPRDHVGWQRIALPAEPDQEPVAILVRHGTVFMASVSTALLILAFAWWRLRDRRAWLVAALCASAAVALSIPEALASFATAALWGFAAALLATSIARRAPRTHRSRPADSTTSLRVGLAHTGAALALLAVAGGVVVALTAGVAALAQGAPPANAADDERGVHRVFVPVDEQYQPTGGKLQVPEALYDALRSRAGQSTTASGGWYVRTARYRASILREAAEGRLSTSDVNVQYALRVDRPGARVRLPLSPAVARAVADGARLEGRPVAIAWSADGDALVAEFDEPGDYEVEFALRSGRGQPESAGLDVGIAPAPDATLELSLPTGVQDVAVPSALGAVERSADGRRIRAALGPAKRLIVGWGGGARLGTAPAAGEVDQLLWLRIQPGSVTLHVRLLVKVAGPSLRELRLSVDPRLRPLIVADQENLIASVEPLLDDPQQLRVSLSRPITGTVTVPLDFLVTGRSGVGEVELPKVECQGMQVGRRWLAVSIDPALAFDAGTVDESAALSVADFLDRWGSAASSPQVSRRMNVADRWRVTTRPREVALGVKQNLRFSVGDRRTLVRLTAELTADARLAASGGYVFLHRVAVPPDLRVDAVSLVEDGIERGARWSRDTAGRIVVFLAAPASGSQRLSISGSLPTPGEGRWQLPQVAVESGGPRESTVQLFRQPAVQVAVHAARGLVESPESSAAAETSASERWVQSWIVDANDYAVSIDVQPNAPHMRFVEVTSLSAVGSAWECQYEVRGQVSQGLVDVVRISLPDQWTGPFEVSPPMPQEIRPGESGGRRELLLVPRAALVGDFAIKIRGPVALEEDKPMPLPATQAERGEEMSSYLVLPAATAAGGASWRIEGAHPVEPASEFLALQAAQGGTLHLVDGEHASVRLAAASAAVTQRLVQANYRVAANAARDWVGAATFDLASSAESAVKLQMPPGSRIVQLRVHERPTIADADSDGVWRVALPPGAGRQSIDVTYLLPAPPLASGHAAVAGPSLVGLAAEATQWTIYTPLGADLAAVSRSGRALRRLEGGKTPNGRPMTPIETLFLARGEGTQLVIDGDASAVELDVGSAPGVGGLPRSVCSLGLLAVGLAVAGGFGRRRWGPYVPHGRHVGLFALGLLAWLWIAPGALGWAAMALATGWWLWDVFRGQAAPGGREGLAPQGGAGH